MLYLLGYVIIAAITAGLLKYTALGNYLHNDPSAEFLAVLSVLVWPFVYVIHGGALVVKILVKLGDWIVKGYVKPIVGSSSGIDLDKY